MQYFVVGQDGVEYGPASLDVLLQWVGEGRVRPETIVRPEGQTVGVPAASIPDLLLSGPVPIQAPPTHLQAPTQFVRGAVYPGIASRASWLYWVGGLSLVNTICYFTGVKFSFAVGLGIAEVLTGLAKAGGPALGFISLGLQAAVIAAIFILGYFACRGALWAFIGGIAILILDTIFLAFFLPETIVGIAIHVWAVISLFQGMSIAKKVEAAIKLQEAGPPSAA